ncbi:hypothetical protein Tco_0446247 [Tanacetum coccineum]
MPTLIMGEIMWTERALAVFVLFLDLVERLGSRRTNALAISTTDANNRKRRKARQQALLWMRNKLSSTTNVMTQRLFPSVVSIISQLALIILSLAMIEPCFRSSFPHHERKTRADRGKKRPCEPNASSSSTTQNPSSSAHMIEPCIRSLLIMSGRHERIEARKDHVS